MRRSWLCAVFVGTAVTVCPGQRLANAPYEPPDPSLSTSQPAASGPWSLAAPGLHAALGSIDVRYPRSVLPELAESQTRWRASAWRGERVAAQWVLWTAEPLRQLRVTCTDLQSSSGDVIDASAVRARFVRYVLADGALVPDVLDSAEQVDVAAQSVRPVWISVDVPASATPETYRGTIQAAAAGGAERRLEVQVEVLEQALPPPSRWRFHLDLWQNPYAVARFHHVRPWSAAHRAVLEPHLRLLAEAGQKCITTTIVHRPWGTQTYDPYDSMVQWTRRRDGTWSYDFSALDTYVEWAMECGIDREIHCYSMIPWSGRVRYRDEATGDDVDQPAAPDADEFAALWTPFLRAFESHLRERGWLEITAIAMDERPLALMKPAIALLRSAAPELRIALAGSNEPELAESIDNWCVYFTPPLERRIAQERSARGRTTTFYVCCVPDRPNTFTASPPAEACWLGLYAAAQGYDGLLRWAYDSWTADPLWDTTHVTWPAGDCFLVYPGARSSIRFERLRDGIEDYEKMRVLREARPDAGAARGDLDAALHALREGGGKEDCAAAVQRVEAALERASRGAE